MSESKKELFNNDEEFYERFRQIRKEVASRPEFREHLKRISSNRTPEQLKKLGESVKASWTEERRKEKSEEVKNVMKIQKNAKEQQKLLKLVWLSYQKKNFQEDIYVKFQ